MAGILGHSQTKERATGNPNLSLHHRATSRLYPFMERNHRMPRSSPRASAKPATLELPPDRAFVLHLDVRAQPPRRLAGRVEHITSGEVAHVTSVRQLLVFLAEVLRHQVQGNGK